MICKKCGFKSDESVKYCPQCGAPLEERRKPKSRRIFLIAGFAVILIILSIIPVVGTLLESKENTASSSIAKNPTPFTEAEKELSEAEKKELQSCLARVSNFHGEFGFIDKTGEEVIPCIYSNANAFSENGFAAVAKEDENSEEKWGFIDRNGDEITPFQYDQVKNFSSNGMAAVAKKGSDGILHWGYINTEGSEIIPCEYEDAEYFYENGLAFVQKDSLYGAINKNGETVIPIQYQSISPFGSDGLALAIRTDETGSVPVYIDANGAESEAVLDPDTYIIKGPKYQNLILAFQITEDGKLLTGCLNEKGETIIPFEYDTPIMNEITGDLIINDLLIFSKENSAGNSEYSFFDLQGNPFTSESYNGVSSYNSDTGLLVAVKEEENGDTLYNCMDSDGNSFFPDEYDFIEVSENDDWVSTSNFSEDDSRIKNEYFNSSGEKVWELPDNYLRGGSFTKLS